ncbi:hypothetical protein [Streptomyces violaceusniger]|uniref:hypothetical protein n=1 Tax=Streptomyces violaceusniger TaxID=68280 RepID=UPI0036C42E5D
MNESFYLRLGKGGGPMTGTHDWDVSTPALTLHDLPLHETPPRTRSGVSVLAEEDREAIVRRVGPALQAVLVPPQLPTR